MIVASVILGILATLPIINYARDKRTSSQVKLLGRSLIIAALVYPIFALIWGDIPWLVIELVGVVIYGSFYYLARVNSPIWLAWGWLLHVVWDVLLHLWGPGTHIVPHWYAYACLSFDFMIAAYVYRNLNKQG